MRVLLVAHVGQTVGHLIRTLTVAEALRDRGAAVTVATDRRAHHLIAARGLAHAHVRWDWSHNDFRIDAPANTVARVLQTNEDLMRVMKDLPWDLVISAPGVFTAQAARAAGIRHLSLVHGVYLSKLVDRRGLGSVERRILMLGESYFEHQAQLAFDALEHELDLPAFTYDEFLADEELLVPDPLIPIRENANILRVPFISGSYGPPPAATLFSRPREACLVTFGSGNPCDLSELVTSVRRHFSAVVVCSPRPVRDAAGAVVVASAASSRLAPLVKAVVSHGGIGTLGTFAGAGVPQLILPTEIDQATTAVHAASAGLAHVHGLDAWTTRPALGRRLALNPSTLEHDLAALAATERRAPWRTSGAETIAAFVLERSSSASRPRDVAGSR
jgi:UDP:flavonoid glycosyltransferase YjiC (YdhE family)